MSARMKRREFITLLAGAAATPMLAPFAARAQQPAPHTIGYISSRSLESEGVFGTAFRQALAETDFIEGQNVRIEYRFSGGQDNRLPALAAELVRQKVAVLVASDGPSATAAKAATSAIPIVFSAGADPITLGLVESLNRPTGNATGVYVFIAGLGPKRLQLLHEVIPHAKLIAFVVNVSSGSGLAQAEAMQEAAKAMGQPILVQTAATTDEIDKAFATIVERRADGIVYSASPFFQVMREKLVALAAQHAIPAI